MAWTLFLMCFDRISALLGRTTESDNRLDAAIWSIVWLFERVFATLPHEAELPTTSGHGSAPLGVCHGLQASQPCCPAKMRVFLTSSTN